ncbi:MAG: 30S ribosomal protein S20 [Planctomycetota bacterium]|nr:30S ribosomal protein S20 [Planctomycetota bacterium]
MANSLQAKKRIRQNEKSRIRNKSAKSEIRTLTKKFNALVESQDKAGAESVSRELTSSLDKAEKNHLFHRNNIARQKSAIAKSLAGIQG